jgi:hypothetical protein
MQETQQHDSVDVFVGVDVGKGQHHAVALDRSGKRLYNKALHWRGLPPEDSSVRTKPLPITAPESVTIGVFRVQNKYKSCVERPLSYCLCRPRIRPAAAPSESSPNASRHINQPQTVDLKGFP